MTTNYKSLKEVIRLELQNSNVSFNVANETHNHITVCTDMPLEAVGEEDDVEEDDDTLNENSDEEQDSRLDEEEEDEDDDDDNMPWNQNASLHASSSLNGTKAR